MALPFVSPSLFSYTYIVLSSSYSILFYSSYPTHFINPFCYLIYTLCFLFYFHHLLYTPYSHPFFLVLKIYNSLYSFYFLNLYSLFSTLILPYPILIIYQLNQLLYYLDYFLPVYTPHFLFYFYHLLYTP